MCTLVLLLVLSTHLLFLLWLTEIEIKIEEDDNSSGLRTDLPTDPGHAQDQDLQGEM